MSPSVTGRGHAPRGRSGPAPLPRIWRPGPRPPTLLPVGTERFRLVPAKDDGRMNCSTNAERARLELLVSSALASLMDESSPPLPTRRAIPNVGGERSRQASRIFTIAGSTR